MKSLQLSALLLPLFLMTPSQKINAMQPDLCDNLVSAAAGTTFALTGVGALGLALIKCGRHTAKVADQLGDRAPMMAYPAAGLYCTLGVACVGFSAFGIALIAGKAAVTAANLTKR